MRIRWTQPASRDLTQICDYLSKEDSPATARRVAILIYERVHTLMEFPELGRSGRKAGTRETHIFRSALSRHLSSPKPRY